jgi:hypothetical protein
MCLGALGLNGRWRTANDLQPCDGHALDCAQRALLRGVAEGYGHTARAGTRCPANAMHIVL